MVSILVSLVFHILCASIGHEYFVFAMRGAILHLTLRVSEIVAGMMIAHLIAKGIASSVLRKRMIFIFVG